MKILASLVLIISFSFSQAQGQKDELHSNWNSLLKLYVNEDGMVNYTGFQKSEAKLDSYLATLAENVPQNDWSKEDQLAFYINLYNAATIKMVLMHMPLESIMHISVDGKSAFEIDFIQLGKRKISLQSLENSIIRPEFKEPRIHFALVCAAMSCPKLYNKAFTGSQLEEQLNTLTSGFLKDNRKNRYENGKVYLSKIFTWYKEDFGGDEGLLKFIQPYFSTQFSAKTKVVFNEYDWALNSQ